MKQVQTGVIAVVVLLGLVAGLFGPSRPPAAQSVPAPVMLADGNATPTPTPPPAAPDGECDDNHCIG